MIDVILRYININVPSQGEMIFKITESQLIWNLLLLKGHLLESLIFVALWFAKSFVSSFSHWEDLTELTQISCKFQNVPKTLTVPIPAAFLSWYRDSFGKKLQLPQQTSTCSKTVTGPILKDLKYVQS